MQPGNINGIQPAFVICTGKYKARGLKSTDRACEVCTLRPRALYFPGKITKRVVFRLLAGTPVTQEFSKN